MFGIRGWELIIILIIVILLFGPAKIPELARKLGEAIREFRGSVSGAKDEFAGGLEGKDATRETDRQTGGDAGGSTQG